LTQNPAHQQFACAAEKALSRGDVSFSTRVFNGGHRVRREAAFRYKNKANYGKELASFKKKPPLHRTRTTQSGLVSHR